MIHETFTASPHYVATAGRRHALLPLVLLIRRERAEILSDLGAAVGFDPRGSQGRTLARFDQVALNPELFQGCEYAEIVVCHCREWEHAPHAGDLNFLTSNVGC